MVELLFLLACAIGFLLGALGAHLTGGKTPERLGPWMEDVLLAHMFRDGDYRDSAEVMRTPSDG